MFNLSLKRLFHSVGVPLNKLKFTFIKSSGPGGQNVNKSKKNNRETKRIKLH